MRFFEAPGETRFDWRFQIAGVPVRVSPWFWIVSVIAGLREDLLAMLMWVVVCFVSILIHEFGHVLALRMLGERTRVILYAFGGWTAADSSRWRSTTQRMLVAAAGPVVGLLAAALIIVAIKATGGEVRFFFGPAVTPNWVALPPALDELNGRFTILGRVLLPNDLLRVNLYWSLINLLPVYPLDGGRIARTLWMDGDRVNGWRRSLTLSAVVAALLGIQAVFAQSFYLVLLLGVLAVLSVQARDEPSGRASEW